MLREMRLSIHRYRKPSSIHHLSGISNDRLHGNLGDQCQRAWVAPVGWHLRLHQEALRSAQEEKAGLCPGLQWVRANFGALNEVEVLVLFLDLHLGLFFDCRLMINSEKMLKVHMKRRVELLFASFYLRVFYTNGQ